MAEAKAKLKPNDVLSLIKSNHLKPPRLGFFGPSGVGKSGFASDAPSPIVIDAEGGLGGIKVDAFPQAMSFEEVRTQVAGIAAGGHDYKTLVLDTADWIDALINEHVCKIHKVKSIDEVSYGKGYTAAANLWRELLKSLDALRDTGMLIIFTAHSQVSNIEDPLVGSYSKTTLKMSKKAQAILEEWLDVIGYCDWGISLHPEDKKDLGKFQRALDTGGRIIHLVGGPAFTAKNRYHMPDTIPLDFPTFQEAYKEATKHLRTQEQK